MAGRHQYWNPTLTLMAGGALAGLLQRRRTKRRSQSNSFRVRMTRPLLRRAVVNPLHNLCATGSVGGPGAGLHLRSLSSRSRWWVCVCRRSTAGRARHERQHGVRDDVPGRRPVPPASERTLERGLDAQSAAHPLRRERLPHRRHARPVRPAARLQDERGRVGRPVQVVDGGQNWKSTLLPGISAGRLARRARVADQGPREGGDRSGGAGRAPTGCSTTRAWRSIAATTSRARSSWRASWT